ncbi:ABC transporter [Lachnellula occidentalis]|uniref:ABC transporter n=1 Tax=Lachnellula occidentalis TaxID=215460 RepID=A0A8H8S611_9HELO|nr:ABC transporter [Lachnellula occidentalis]
MDKALVDDSATADRPLSRDSANPWSTSATLPVSTEEELHHASPENGATKDSKAEKTSPTPWDTSATLPVSPDAEADEAPPEREAAAAAETPKPKPAPKTTKKKVFSTAEHKTAFLHFVRIFSYSTFNDKLLLFAACIASICTGITMPLMNIVFGQLVAAFGSLYNPYTYTSHTKADFIHTINQNVLYMVYLFAGRLVLDYVAFLGFRMVSLRISAAMRLAYMKALFAQPLSTLDVLPPGQTASIITITANVLQIGISEKFSTFIQSTTLVIAALVIAFLYSAILTLVTCSGLVFIATFYFGTVTYLVKGMKQVEHADRMSSAIASEAFGSIRMLAACGAEPIVSNRFAGWVKESRRRGLRLSPLVALQGSPVFFAIHATFALAFWYAIKMYLDFKMKGGVKEIIIVLMSIMMITLNIGSIATPLSAAAQAAGSASIFFTVIDAPRPRTGGVTEPDVSSQEDIVLENVNFAYPIRPDVKVLSDLSLRFPAGKLTASASYIFFIGALAFIRNGPTNWPITQIVGASGSGKSTIVGLIERWYELNGNTTDNLLTLLFRTGTIKTCGTNLHDIDLKWWRRQIGLVQQEPFLFNDTIFNNVVYGLIGTEWENEPKERKKELVEQACQEAFADEFITRLPEGYETTVGDAGIKLSGGQRQRLAIARSIIKHPKILILDEATSAIDVRGEKIVQAALDKVSQGRTTITIAHRLSTIMKADNIVVLKKGRVVQQGTHDELLADSEGAYWALANAQHLSLGDEGENSEDWVDFEDPSLDNTTIDKFSVDIPAVTISEEPEFKKKGFLGSFGLLFWEQRQHWPWYILMLLGSVGAGAAFPLQAFIFAKLISIFSYWGVYLQEQTNWWCLMFTILAIGVGVSHFMLGWASNTIAFNITSTYRQEYFQNILLKPISYYDDEKNSVGALTARIATDPTQLQQLLGINMAFVLISVLNVVGCISMSFYFGWKLTLLTVVSSVPIILAAGFFRIRYETQFEKMNWTVFSESAKFATESIGAIRTVTSLTLESEICERYESLLNEHISKAFHKARFSTLVFAMSDSVSLLCMAFVMWYGGGLLASYQYWSFNYLVVYLAVIQGSISAGQWLSYGPNIAQAAAAANRIRGMRATGDAERELSPLDFTDQDEDEKGARGVKIELKNIWFQYPTRDVPVLTGVSMTIEKGQFAAIVGPSGCGKTSVISLLERFYRPQSGKILFRGLDINELSLSDYRKSLSLVAQEASLFDGTLRENILLGVDQDATEDETLYQACRNAEIHDFISSLPDGYDTEVGTKGVALSGGQKQRIAIARALIRNPRVLLLDEATSNLDSETEKSVQAVFEKTGKGRTMVVVAHRLATIQNADVIFVIGDGKVVEQGNHSMLLRKRGLYYQMCQSQALDR